MAVALVVAAGRGERLGSDRPKAFVIVAGRPMLEWCVDALRQVPAIDRIVVALPAGEDAPDGCVGVPGGAVRAASVAAALAAGAGDPVLIHDAARPLLRPELVERVLDALVGVDGAIAAARVTDTTKQADADGIVTATLDRSRLWAVQTPQAFHRSALERALDVPPDVLARATDESWLVERAGGRIRIVESSPENLKITTPRDLRISSELLAERLAASPGVGDPALGRGRGRC
ncbi:MAG TPA: 2-C-methyl-D-erythritol 4-phosphate cytidylyltransferase [Solirubrobacteraceae bacterium]|jgi:2-C-methyl-D-erythritol 4-phosphate cytidylyltransferase|nr:2-C-methyl-D-erythritol 4-phosphate cytidylyltransferase [Solirubrobacteraceae bacterium]